MVVLLFFRLAVCLFGYECKRDILYSSYRLLKTSVPIRGVIFSGRHPGKMIQIDIFVMTRCKDNKIEKMHENWTPALMCSCRWDRHSMLYK